jgi:signal transduction histidine kinase
MSEMNDSDLSLSTAKSMAPLLKHAVMPGTQAARFGIQTLGCPVGDPDGCSRVYPEQQVDPLLFVQQLELERQRIAMDLHDGLGPLITLIKLELQNAKILIGKQRGALELARAAIQRAEENIARTFDELRRTVLDLHPAVLDDLGIVHALRWLIRQFELSGTDVCIQSKLMADDGAVPITLKIVIFRVCQETLNNVIKHANARHVVVALEIAGADLLLSIEDDGGGMAVATTEVFNRSGSGLPGIAWRAHISNGKLTVDSASGRGTRITIRWALAKPACTSKAEPSGNENPVAAIITQ